MKTPDKPVNPVYRESLQAVKSQVFDIIESMNDVFIILDKNWRFVYLNRNGELLAGKSCAQLVGKSIHTLYPQFRRTEFYKRYKQAADTQEATRFEERFEGTDIWYEVNVYPVSSGLYIYLTDITGRKRNEQAQQFLSEVGTILSSSLEYEKTLQQVARQAVPVIADWCSVDIVNPDGSIKHVALAHTDQEMVKFAEKFREQYPPDPNAPTGAAAVARTGRPEVINDIPEAVIKKAARSPEHYKMLRKLQIKNYMCVPLMLGNHVLGTATFVSSKRAFDDEDLAVANRFAHKAALAIENARLYRQTLEEIAWRENAQKQLLQLQEELRYSKDQLETILATSADGITVQDQTGRLTYVNDAAAMLTGFPSAEAMQQATTKEIMGRFEMIDESGAPLPLERLPGRRALAGEIAPEEVVGYRIKKTGEERWSSVRATPLLDDQGNVQYAVNIFHDITERKQLEKRKDDFIGMASHELKTPLTTLKILTQGLRDLITGPGRKGEKALLVRIDNQIDRLNELVRDLLDVSKINTGTLEIHPRSFNVAASLKKLVADFQAQTTDHEIRGDWPKRLLLYADPTRFEQVVNNFLSNAIKYSPRGGPIEIRATKTKKSVIVSVTDRGIGIAHENQLKIFERFFREKRSGQAAAGLGMGLYICLQIVKLHGGRVWVESRREEGSTFFAEFPLGK